jgi:hypothetical protein
VNAARGNARDVGGAGAVECVADQLAREGVEQNGAPREREGKLSGMGPGLSVGMTRADRRSAGTPESQKWK